MEGAAPQKKGPGRPKKKVVHAPIDWFGVVDRPRTPGDVIELTYQNPDMFKRLDKMFHNYECREVHMHFYRDRLIMSARDHLGKTTIYISIMGRNLNLYYCEKDISISIMRANLERVLSTINPKQHSKIGFYMRETDYRGKLHILLDDAEYLSQDQYELDITHIERIQNLDAMNADEGYPVIFTLSGAHIKRKICGVKKMPAMLSIQVGPGNLLELRISQTNMIEYTGIYRQMDKLILTNRLLPDEMLLTSVMIEYIKPFSNSWSPATVKIAVHKTEKLAISTCIDKIHGEDVAVIKIYTEIANGGIAAV